MSLWWVCCFGWDCVASVDLICLGIALVALRFPSLVFVGDFRCVLLVVGCFGLCFGGFLCMFALLA